MPRPAPVCAPSIKPGKSATTNVRPPPFSDGFPGAPSAETTPRPGSQRRERIIGNFRMRRGNARNERGLARVRKSDQADVRQQFQLKVQMALLAGLPFFGFARRLMPGLGEVLIAAPAAPALRDQDALARLGQIGDLLAGVLIGDDGADRHEQNHVRAGVARAVRAFAVPAAVGFEFAVVAVAQQRVVVRIRFQVNAAAMAAVAARRSAARHEFFAAKRDAAVPAVAGLHVDFGFVNKHVGHFRTSEYDYATADLHWQHRFKLSGFSEPCAPRKPGSNDPTDGCRY